MIIDGLDCKRASKGQIGGDFEMGFWIGITVGIWFGVLLMCLLSMAKEEGKMRVTFTEKEVQEMGRAELNYELAKSGFNLEGEITFIRDCANRTITYIQNAPEVQDEKILEETVKRLLRESGVKLEVSWDGDSVVLVKGEDKVRISRDQMFMDIAKVVSKRSSCGRNKVGAVIVKDSRIVSIGYNGPPSGYPECSSCVAGCDISIHAEMNAIAFAAKSGVSIEGGVLYVTLSPCVNCAKIILNSGIREVVYGKDYRILDGVVLLEEYLPKVRQLNECDGAGPGARWLQMKGGEADGPK